MFKQDFKKILLVMASLITMTFSPQLLAWLCNNDCGALSLLEGQLECYAYVAGCEIVKNGCIGVMALAEEKVRRDNGGSGDSLTDSQKAKLRPFTGDLVDAVTIHYNANLAADTFCWNGRCVIDDLDTKGQTFGHHIYLRDEQTNSNDISQIALIGHEMKHVEQIERVGTGVNWYSHYCIHWVYDDDYTYFKCEPENSRNCRGNSLEMEAYAFEWNILDNFPTTLNITKMGMGNVTSVPTGIDCGSDCTEEYIQNTVVTLTANAESGHIFTGWGGDCFSRNITMYTDSNCIATFVPVVATKTTNGGTISPVNTVPEGTTASFTVTPDSGGWITNTTVSGNCPPGSWNGNVYTTGIITSECAVSFSFYNPGAMSIINTLLLDDDETSTTLLTDGVCGNANGQSFATEPTTDLCSSGNPSAVVATGTWNWSCDGINGGNTANCSAYMMEVIDNVCYKVASTEGWQRFDFSTPVNEIVSIEGGWSVDEANYEYVGPEGHTGAAADSLAPYNGYKYDETYPFGALLLKTPNSEHKWITNPQFFLESISEVYMRINDKDEALGNNVGHLTVCFSTP